MRSRLEIVAECRFGRTIVSAIRGGGHYAARLTGDGIVHLIGTAAGPLGGDDVTLSVRLGPGARLAVRSAGATIIQPGPQVPDSRLRLELQVGDGAQLDVGCEPTVITQEAVHESATVVHLAGSGQLRLLEQVLLGRSGERAGEWAGRLRVDRDGSPVLRQVMRSAQLTGSGGRVISTLFQSGVDAGPATCGGAVAMPLAAGGLLVTATGTTLIATRADLTAALERATPAVGVSRSGAGRCGAGHSGAGRSGVDS